MKLFKRSGSEFWWYTLHMPDGERVRRSTKTRNKQAAGIIAAREMAEVEQHGLDVIRRKCPTLAEFSTEFLQWITDANSIKPTTKRLYRYGVQALLGTKLAPMPMNAIAQVHVETCDLGSPYTTNLTISVLQKMYSTAKEMKRFYGETPKLKRLKAEGRAIAMTRSQAEEIATHMTGDARDVLLLIRSTGMRPREVFEMRWEYVDFERAVYNVPRTKTKEGERACPLVWHGLEILRRRHLEAGLPKQG